MSLLVIKTVLQYKSVYFKIYIIDIIDQKQFLLSFLRLCFSKEEIDR